MTIAETWFDKGQTIVAGGQGYLEKMLNPGAVDTVTIQTLAWWGTVPPDKLVSLIGSSYVGKVLIAIGLNVASAAALVATGLPSPRHRASAPARRWLMTPGRPA